MADVLRIGGLSASCYFPTKLLPATDDRYGCGAPWIHILNDKPANSRLQDLPAGSTLAKKRKKRRGHFCWCCRSTLPNERFSGRGHRRHLCKKCSRLGKEELEYRQAVRNIDRCLDWSGRPRRKQRKTFERFRHHASERVRRYVEELEAYWAEERRQWRELRRLDEALEEAWENDIVARAEAANDEWPERGDLPADFEDDEIPF